MSKKESDRINLIDISQSTLVYFFKYSLFLILIFTHRLYLSPMSPLPLLQAIEATTHRWPFLDVQGQ